MIVIEIEGLDKSGKHTQTMLLKQYLESNGYNVVTSEFHRYDTPIGGLIRGWLRNEWDANVKTVELLMAADKHAQQDWFNQLEESGVEVLLLDRYLGSQYSFAKYKGVDLSWLQGVMEGVREPNLTILLDIEPEESIKRIGKHGDNDRHESNLKLLSGVRESYLEYIKNREGLLIDVTNNKSSVTILAEITEFLENKLINYKK